jgi:glutathione S-transferase
MLLCRYEIGVRPKELFWQAWYDDQWDRAWTGLAQFEAHPDILTRPIDAAKIALVCTLGYADFRFPDCGCSKAFPKLDAFHDRMLQRDSVKVSAPPKG